MSQELIEPSTRANDNANYALQTFSNYIGALILEFEQKHGPYPDGIDIFTRVIKDSANLSVIQEPITISDNLRNSYNRGKLTWQAIRSLPINEHPELAISANYWLPVQSYYAINGFGNACLIVLNQMPRSQHASFCREFSEIIRPYFPSPINAQCSGGPRKEDFNYIGLTATAVSVNTQSNLQNPSIENACALIGKALSTTRQETINGRFRDKRKKKKKLSFAEKCSICESISNTSIADFLYRLRINSNYDNPDMYIYSDTYTASNQYKDLLYLTEIIIAGIKAIIEERLGIERMGQL